MSSVIVVAPIIVASWPVLTQIITSAVVSMGFAVVQGSLSQSATAKNRTVIDIPDSEVLAEEMDRGEELVVERDGIVVRFSRDERGSLKLCVDGSMSKVQLQELGEELLGRITQQFVYHRVMSELQDRGVAVIGEEVAQDRTVKIRVKAW